jgi:hypothetical protein
MRVRIAGDLLALGERLREEARRVRTGDVAITPLESCREQQLEERAGTLTIEAAQGGLLNHAAIFRGLGGPRDANIVQQFADWHTSRRRNHPDGAGAVPPNYVRGPGNMLQDCCDLLAVLYPSSYDGFDLFRSQLTGPANERDPRLHALWREQRLDTEATTCRLLANLIADNISRPPSGKPAKQREEHYARPDFVFAADGSVAYRGRTLANFPTDDPTTLLRVCSAAWPMTASYSELEKENVGFKESRQRLREAASAVRKALTEAGIPWHVKNIRNSGYLLTKPLPSAAVQGGRQAHAPRRPARQRRARRK